MTEVDFIVVGAGSSGGVLAARLAQGGASTLLLEQGDASTGNGDENPRTYSVLDHAHISRLPSTAQPYLNNRHVDLLLGRALGGGSAVNSMIYVRGHRADYDSWGYERWRYEKILPFFLRSEGYRGPDSLFHGRDGPLKTGPLQSTSRLSHAFLEAAVASGFDGPDWDFNGIRQENGAGLFDFTLDEKGRRSSVYTAFLENPPDGLRILTAVRVLRVCFKGNVAREIEALVGSTRTIFSARRAIILAAGALETPCILLRSGIGEPGQLRSFDIQVVHENPAVGRNLHDHISLGVVYRLKKAQEDGTVLPEAAVFHNPWDREGLPEIETMFLSRAPGQDGEACCLVNSILLRPESRGTVQLSASQPLGPPRVNPHYLERTSDRERLAETIEVTRALVRHRPLADLIEAEAFPNGHLEIPDCLSLYAFPNSHFCGTCSMGRVVDDEFRVLGVEGLRVVDASVIRMPLRGHIQATCMMLAEVASGLLLAEVNSGTGTPYAA